MMENSEINIAKKFFDRHLLNKVSQITDFYNLPKRFRLNVFGGESGKRHFYEYLSNGDFFWVNGKDSSYLIWMSPDDIKIVDAYDRFKTESDVEWELNLPVVGLYLRDFLTKIKNKNEMNESIIKNVIRKVIQEQEENLNPQLFVDEMNKKIKSGFCKIQQKEKPKVKLLCKDGNHYMIEKIRIF